MRIYKVIVKGKGNVKVYTYNNKYDTARAIDAYLAMGYSVQVRAA